MVAATAVQDLRGELERRAALAEVDAVVSSSESTAEDADDAPSEQGPKVASFLRPQSLSLLSLDEMCGGRCYTDEELFKDYNDLRARMAEEDRQASLQGKASLINAALEEGEGDRVVELFDPSLIDANDFNLKTKQRRRSSSSTDPRDRIELQRKLDMEKVVGSLSDFNAVRLGTLGPLTAGQDKLNQKRAAYIKQVLDDFVPVAADRGEVFVLYALSAVHDDDAYAIFAKLANNRRLSKLLELPNVVRWIKARGLDTSLYAEPSESWTRIFPGMGRGIKRFVKDDRPGKYQSQKPRLPDEYIDVLSKMETAEYERNLTVKNTIIAAIDEVTFGAPHGLIDLGRSTVSGIVDVAHGEYEQAGEKLSGAAIVVLTHVGVKAWRSVRPSVNVAGAGTTLALEADAQGTLARVRERFGTGGNRPGFDHAPGGQPRGPVRDRERRGRPDGPARGRRQRASGGGPALGQPGRGGRAAGDLPTDRRGDRADQRTHGAGYGEDEGGNGVALGGRTEPTSRRDAGPSLRRPG